MARPDFLREGFGALGLPGWEEIYVPDRVPMTPQTIGWAVLGALLLGVLAWVAWVAVRRFRDNRYRRAALRELDVIRRAPESHGDSLPALLKRTALGAFPRGDVASLTGEPWLTFLERTCPGAGFDHTVGDTLVRLAYRGSGGISPADMSRLIDVSEAWIRGHRAVV
ncbi:MAG: DUF4381 domain-containing protein [Myxococcota bacterium]